MKIHKLLWCRSLLIREPLNYSEASFPHEVSSQPRENTATEERVNDVRAGQNHEDQNLDNQHQTEPSQGLRRSKRIESRVETEL